MIAAHRCCRFVRCTCEMRLSHSITYQRLSVGNYEGHLSTASLCSGPEWFELCGMARYPAGSSHRKMSTLRSIIDKQYLQQYSGRLWDWSHYASARLNYRHCQTIFLFTSDFDPTIFCCSRNKNSSHQTIDVQSSIVQFWWDCANYILSFLFLGRSDTWCGLLLL